MVEQIDNKNYQHDSSLIQRTRRSYIFYIFILSFAIGIAFRSLFDLGLSFIVLLILISLVIALVDRKSLLLSISLVLFSMGAIRMDFAEYRDFALDKYLGQDVEISGVIILEPSKRENSTQIVLEVEDSKERVLIITERTNVFQYGDLISAHGLVREPENFRTDNNREFDYINYLGKDKIFYRMIFPEIEMIDSGRGNIFRQKLFTLKNKLVREMDEVIPSPESKYMSGLTFGVKESLGEELEKDFRRTGLIHVVVLSGYNVTIVANSIFKVFGFLPYNAGLGLGIFSIIAFALMTGAGATIVRASIMAILAVIGKATDKPYAITKALFLAGFLMVLHNPKILLFDPSFQLSFLATLGLIHLSPILASKLKFLTEAFQIRELVASTLATQIFVLPLLLNKIGEMSLIAPITNLLVLPFVPATMFLGFLTSILGLISNFLSSILGSIAFVFLTYQIKIVEFFGNLSFASVEIKTFPIWAMLLVYLLYLWLYKKRQASL
jgi:competence protein ComEC